MVGQAVSPAVFLGRRRRFRQSGHDPFHALPARDPDVLPQPLLRRFPVWLGIRDLPLARGRETKQALPLVFSSRYADPALLPHQSQRPRQRRAVHGEARAEPFLIGLSNGLKSGKQAVLGDFEACLSQFLVINPRDRPRSASQILTSARQGK